MENALWSLWLMALGFLFLGGGKKKVYGVVLGLFLAGVVLKLFGAFAFPAEIAEFFSLPW